MIEPTDEMRRAGAQAIADADLAENNGTPEEYAEPVIRAVLALLERDYCLERRGHRPTRRQAKRRCLNPGPQGHVCSRTPHETGLHCATGVGGLAGELVTW